MHKPICLYCKEYVKPGQSRLFVGTDVYHSTCKDALQRQRITELEAKLAEAQEEINKWRDSFILVERLNDDRVEQLKSFLRCPVDHAAIEGDSKFCIKCGFYPDCITTEGY